MKRMLGGLLLLVALPVWAADVPPGCAWLCGNWVLDEARSDSPATVVETALEKYRAPAPPRPPKQRADAPPPAGGVAEPEFEPWTKTRMREQLLAEVTPPATLELAEKGDEILIRIPDTPNRRIFPGEPHSRVDSQGTAKIRADWKKDSLVIDESYSGKHGQVETFALQPDGTLSLTRVFERPGVKSMRLKQVYRRR